MIKSYLKSKTIWLAVIQIAVAVLMFVQGQIEVGAGLTIKSIIDIILRTITNQAIGTSSKKVVE